MVQKTQRLIISKKESRPQSLPTKEDNISDASSFKTRSFQDHHILPMQNICRKLIMYLSYFCCKMLQITFSILSFIKISSVCLLQDIVTIMRTLVVLLFTFFISFNQGQNFGLTESDYDEG